MTRSTEPRRERFSRIGRAGRAVALAGCGALLIACAGPSPVSPEPVTPPSSALVLLHGFLRGPEHHAGQVRALAEAGVLVVTLALPSLLSGDAARDEAVEVALAAVETLRARLAEPTDPLHRQIDPGRIALAGFSAGGAVALEAAVRLAAAGRPPATLILLDPVPWARTLAAAAELPPVPVLLLAAPPSGCNADGAWASIPATLNFPIESATIPGASHCDFEDPSDGLCRLVCGADDPARRAAITARIARFLTALGDADRLSSRADRPGR